MPRYCLRMAYLGGAFHGWQKQLNVAHTVQGELERALQILAGYPVETVGSGRTDTGVHAREQFVHFDMVQSLGPPACRTWAQKLNGLLGANAVVYHMARVSDDFHARFQATSRTYRYQLHLEADPFKQGLSYFCRKELDFELMNVAASHLLTTTDFTPFAKLHGAAKHNLCDVFHAGWQEVDATSYYFEIEANRFLRGMVRLLVGTLIDVGQGKRTLDDWIELLHLGPEKSLLTDKRLRAAAAAPAMGLYLHKVSYPPGLIDDLIVTAFI